MPEMATAGIIERVFHRPRTWDVGVQGTNPVTHHQYDTHGIV